MQAHEIELLIFTLTSNIYYDARGTRCGRGELPSACFDCTAFKISHSAAAAAAATAADATVAVPPPPLVLVLSFV